MIKPILSNTKLFVGASILIGASMLGLSECSKSSKKSNVDLASCHNVNMCGDTIKIQDGVSLELKSKIYLMNNGKLVVYDKDKKTWSDADYKIDKIYNYQQQTFIDIAKATTELEDTLVLSKEDIEYMQEYPEELDLNNDYTNPYNAQTSGVVTREVKSTEGNSIVIDAEEHSYAVNHSTPNLTVSYDMNEETVLNVGQ